VCTDQGSFLKNFLTNSELRINYELMMMQSMMQVMSDGGVHGRNHCTKVATLTYIKKFEYHCS
jgi:hypothetical protein